MPREHYRPNGKLEQGYYCTTCGAPGLSMYPTDKHGLGQCPSRPDLVKLLEKANAYENHGVNVIDEFYAYYMEKIIENEIDITWSKENDGVNVLPTVFCDGASSGKMCQDKWDMFSAIDKCAEESKEYKTKLKAFTASLPYDMKDTYETLNKSQQFLVMQMFNKGWDCGRSEERMIYENDRKDQFNDK